MGSDDSPRSDSSDGSLSNSGFTPADEEDAVHQLIQLFPEDKRSHAEPFFRAMFSVATHHSGPLPRPEDMAGYEAAFPGSAARILAMAEKEQANRHGAITRSLDLDAERIQKDHSLKTAGQVCAMIALALLVGLTAFIAYIGDTQSAVWLGGATIVAVVGIFVTGKLVDERRSEADTELTVSE